MGLLRNAPGTGSNRPLHPRIDSLVNVQKPTKPPFWNSDQQKNHRNTTRGTILDTLSPTLMEVDVRFGRLVLLTRPPVRDCRKGKRPKRKPKSTAKKQTTSWEKQPKAKFAPSRFGSRAASSPPGAPPRSCTWKLEKAYGNFSRQRPPKMPFNHQPEKRSRFGETPCTHVLDRRGLFCNHHLQGVGL